MSSPEVEKFEVTEDDLVDEFNPYRRSFKQSKNRATYGIWADDSDDEGDRPSFGRGSKKSGDYTAPIGFVSGGIKVGDKVSQKEEAEDDDDRFTDSDEDDKRQQFPTAFGSKKAAPQVAKTRPPPSGIRSMRPERGVAGTGIGDWERHTKGIGMHLLTKMGYKEGTGLGKTSQGITTPVEAFKRKGKGAIGFHGSERTSRSLQDYPVKPDSEEEEEEEFKSQLSQWKKSGSKVKKKPKYVYKTADDIIASAGKRPSRELRQAGPKVKVIDMTKKEKRVLSGYHAIANRHDRPDDDELFGKSEERKVFDMPELLHNLDLLCEMSEDEIIQNNKRLQFEKDLIINLRHEKEKLDEVCALEEKQINKMREIIGVVESCEQRLRPGSTDPLSLSECAKLFKQLQDEHYEEYKVFELSAAAVALIFPILKEEFSDWKPLENPSFGTDMLKQWKDVLDNSNQVLYEQGQGQMEPYERLIWELWMPAMRKTAMTDWNVRNCDPLIEVLEAWLPLLPKWVMSNILEQLVLPRIQAEVEQWNPLTDTMPIHSWIHPWLPLMGDQLEPVNGPIRNKLANALKAWHPSDPSAKMILQPWLGVFKPGHMDTFLINNILPKLGLVLQEFDINPHQQVLDPWNWVITWLDLLPFQSMVALLEKHFFPKWHQVLLAWLTNQPNYEEITKWYTGWKGLFPDKLLTHPVIKDQFNRGLEMMNRAVNGQRPVAGSRENVAYLTSTERRRNAELGTHRETMATSSPTPVANVPTSFKDLIERKAEENNIVFVPIPNKTYEAKQVYRFGSIPMYLDRGIIFINAHGQWQPASLSTLVDLAK